MRWRRTFSSRIEQRVALPVVLLLSVLVLGITTLAMEQIRQQTLRQAEDNLARIAKDYGMLLAERLKDRTAYERYFDQGPKPGLSWDGEDTLTISGRLAGQPRQQHISLAQLTRDLDQISGATRCVAINATPSCLTEFPDDLAHRWDLRLVSLFDTEIIISTGVAQAPETALRGIDTIAKVLPYIISLLAAIVGYGVVLYLRRRFRPVPVLRKAIRDIEGGDFFSPVSIDSDDEFSELGEALNSLSNALGGSFGFLQRLSNIDELILSNADLAHVMRRINETALDYARAETVLIAMADAPGILHISGLLEGSAFETQIAYDDQTFAEQPTLSFMQHPVFIPVHKDREAAGWLICDDGADLERISELARKASVGITNISRSESLYKQATFDGLTGLLNRIAFMGQLEQHLNASNRNATEGALLFIDLDDFKNVNDVQGHGTGDRLLCIIADRLSACLRKGDTIARLGGDEFAICLGDFEDKFTLLQLLQRIISEVTTPVQIGQFQHTVNCSIGVCLYPHDGHDSETLLKNADLAMYRAKTTSGSAYAFFDTSLNQESHRRMSVEQRLRDAIEHDELHLHLQPKLRLGSRTIDAAEALVRWHDPVLGHVSPIEFVDVAERAGMIEELTGCVIRMVGQALNELPSLERIAINVSPLQLAQPHFAERFLEQLRSFDCDPGRIEVEVTETVFINDPESVKQKLVALKQNGVRVSLDDFGTGYSSLNLLRQLPLHALKIDKSFVDDIPDDDQAMLMIGKIIEIALGMGIEVIAEGVETNAQLSILEQFQCSTVQGYLICRPIPVPELGNFLKQQDLNSIGLSAVG